MRNQILLYKLRTLLAIVTIIFLDLESSYESMHMIMPKGEFLQGCILLFIYNTILLCVLF